MSVQSMSGLSLPRLLLIGLCGAALSACSIAQGYTEKEQSIVNSLDGGLYQPASRTARDNIETQTALAQAAFWANEYELNPGDLESAVKLSAAVRKIGNPRHAVEIAQLARAMHPRDPYLTAEFAAGLIASERGDEAIKPLQDGLRITPQYARLWSLMGAALDQGEQYTQARKHYGRALSITPHDPSILANMGLSYALEGDAAQAETWLRRAAAIPGAGKGVQQNLDLVLQLQGKTPPPTRTAERPKGPKTSIRPAREYRQALNPNGAPSGYRNSMTLQRPAQAAPRTITPAPTTRSMGATPKTSANYNYSNRAPTQQGGYPTNNYPQTNNGRPMTATDVARAAAARTQGRKMVVPEGAAAPQSSVLETIAGQVGPRSAAGMPARQALAGQRQSSSGQNSMNQNTKYAPTQLPAPPPQGYYNPQSAPNQRSGQNPAQNQAPYQTAPQRRAPTPRGAARRR